MTGGSSLLHVIGFIKRLSSNFVYCRAFKKTNHVQGEGVQALELVSPSGEGDIRGWEGGGDVGGLIENRGRVSS